MGVDLARLAQLDERLGPLWMGPRITDDWPPGWVGVYGMEDGEAIPMWKIGINGRHDDEGARQMAADIAETRNALPELLARLEALEAFVREVVDDESTHTVHVMNGQALLADAGAEGPKNAAGLVEDLAAIIGDDMKGFDVDAHMREIRGDDDEAGGPEGEVEG